MHQKEFHVNCSVQCRFLLLRTTVYAFAALPCFSPWLNCLTTASNGLTVASEAVGRQENFFTFARPASLLDLSPIAMFLSSVEIA